MPALDFPNSPSIGDQITLASVVWTWDGKGWFPTGATSIVNTAFTKVAVSGQSTISSTTTDDVLTAVAGQNITLTTDPATKQLVINATGNLQVQSGYNATRQTFTANGYTNTFTLTNTPTSADNLLVFVSGVQQPRSYYSLTGRNVILGGTPNTGEEIDVIDLSAGISVMGINRSIQSGTAIASQTTVTVTNGYVPGQIDVYLNGVFLFTDEYTATDGLVVTFASPLSAGDEYRIIKYTPLSVAPVDFMIKRESFTAADGQLTFTTVNGYNTGYVDVYLNGIRLVETVDFVATDGYTVVLTSPAAVSDVLLVQTYYTTNTTNITSSNLTITGTVNLGTVSNVRLAGGTTGQVLVNAGNNGLQFATITQLVVGTANVQIYSDGNVTLSPSGRSNAFVVGTSVTSISGNLTVGNVAVSGNVTANYLTLTNRISSTDALFSGNLTINGVTNLNTVANVRLAGGTAGQVLSAVGDGTVQFTNPAVGATIGKSIALAIVFGG